MATAMTCWNDVYIHDFLLSCHDCFQVTCLPPNIKDVSSHSRLRNEVLGCHPWSGWGVIPGPVGEVSIFWFWPVLGSVCNAPGNTGKSMSIFLLA